MSADLRSYLEQLAADPMGELLTVDQELNPRFEMSAVLYKLEQDGRFPAVLFRRSAGSRFPVVANIFSSYRRLGLAIGCTDQQQILHAYMQRERERVPTRTVSRAEAPVKEVVWTGDDVDLRKLPIVTHHEHDSGPYITAGVLVIRDPSSGAYNAGVFRHEVRGPRDVAAFLQPFSHSWDMLQRYGERGQPMPAAICVGHHPAVVMAAASRGPIGDSELEAAGGLLGEPLDMVAAETQPLEVPARAEFVLEGVIYPDRFVEDGPFGEYTGYYGSKQRVPLMELTAITMRQSPIYHDIFASHPDHYVDPLSTEAHVYRSVKQFVPSVVDVHRPRCGSLYHIYVSIKKRAEGQGKMAGMAALACHPNLKHAIVVDDDIDVRNEHEVLWAVATRFQADTGLTLSPYTTGATLDPTAYGEDRAADGTMTTKMIIDATKPVSRPFAQRVVIPRDVLQRIDLQQLLPGYHGAGSTAGNGEVTQAGIDWWTTSKPGGQG